MKIHKFETQIQWTGNLGKGTETYLSYSRDHTIFGKIKTEVIAASSDPIFRGDKTKYNPEELFLASIASCHMLWYLHLCADQGITVTFYEDSPMAELLLAEDGSGKIENIILQPHILIKEATLIDKANNLHHEAHRFCFIASSINSSIKIQARISAD